MGTVWHCLQQAAFPAAGGPRCAGISL
jgi:hypothetical protein